MAKLWFQAPGMLYTFFYGASLLMLQAPSAKL